MPELLEGILTQLAYQKWLHRKSVAHIVRDRKRGNKVATNEHYKVAIHGAVHGCRGRDAYTGEMLAWHKVGTYNNVDSKAGRRIYKASLALMPTLDHVGDGTGAPEFKICGWRTNDAKNDMSLREFVNLCKSVVEFSGKNGKEVEKMASATKQWVYNVESGYYSQRVNRKYAEIKKKFGVKEVDRTTILGEINLNLPSLVEKGIARSEDSEYYRVIIWHDGVEFYVSLKKDDGPKQRLGLKYNFNGRLDG